MSIFLAHCKKFYGKSNQTRRYLITKAGIKSKVLFVSNSGVYATHWALNASPEASRKIYNELVRERKLTVFYRKPWFCNIDQSHYSNNWGQSPRELPLYIQKLFYQINSNTHTQSDPITFKQNKELHEFVANDIRKRLGDSFIEVGEEESPVVYQDDDKNHYFIKYDGSSYFIGDKCTFFYNWLRKPIQHVWKKTCQRYVSNII